MFQLIKEFCDESDNYEFIDNFSKTNATIFGEITITAVAIVVKEGCSAMDMLAQFTNYLERKKVFDERLLELEGTAIDELDQYPVAYFPAVIKDNLGHLCFDLAIQEKT